MSTQHVSWGSIELLHNVVRTLTHLHELGAPLPVVEVRAKVKLHGSNCAVQVHAHGIVAQSRTALLTPEDDYKGFASWAHRHAGYFSALPAGAVVFGEWCGPGVEKGMAISQVSGKQFAVFAVQLDARVVYEPAQLEGLLPQPGRPDNLHILPWQGEPLTVDYGARASLEAVAAELNERVAAVEREDPWVKATFGISGLGEGLVCYPVRVQGGPPPAEATALAQLMFKAKGEKHRTAGTKAAVQVDASVVATIDEFVTLMVTAARLQQGATAVGGRDPKLTGKFLAWIAADVAKESLAELEASGLAWPQVEKAVQARARQWFVAPSEPAS
jgi:hypothetical protein